MQELQKTKLIWRGYDGMDGDDNRLVVFMDMPPSIIRGIVVEMPNSSFGGNDLQESLHRSAPGKLATVLESLEAGKPLGKYGYKPKPKP